MRRLALALLLAAGCSQELPRLPHVYVRNLDAEVAAAWGDYGGVGRPVLYAVAGDGPGGRIVLADRSEVWGATLPGESEVAMAEAYSTAAHELYHQRLFQLGGDGDPDHRRPEWRTLVSAEEATACQTYGADDLCPKAPGDF